MKSELEIIKVHDQLLGVLLQEIPLPMSNDTERALNVAAGVLCWVLDHDHNQSFNLCLADIELWMQGNGYAMERRQN